MASVHNTIHGPEGQPLVGVRVEITLRYNKKSQAIPTDANNDVTVLGTYATTTDADGKWQVDLVPNDNILPANSVYHVIERVRPGRRSFEYYIDVQDGATPEYWIGDILAPEPVWS